MSKEFRVSTFAERLKEAMEEKNLKQSDLSNTTGIDKGSISHYLSGKYEPKQKAINKLAVLLNVSEMWLWGYDVPKERLESEEEIIKRAAFDAVIIKAMDKDNDLREMVKMYMALPEDKKKTVKRMVEDYFNAFA